MFELNEERILMTASDNSVRLTSHRIIHESDGKRQQIMLEDFESYELKNKSIGAYGFILLFLVVIMVLILYDKIKGYFENRQLLKKLNINLLEVIWRDGGFIVLLFVLLVVHFFYLISRRYIIRINGKYNSFEFRVKSFKNKSVRRMLNKLTDQSNMLKGNLKTAE